jgi:hypothetical protein
MMQSHNKYINIYTHKDQDVNLNTLSAKRSWMKDNGAYNCPPMMIGNTLGWFLPLDHSVTLNWNGNNSPGSVKIKFTESGENVPNGDVNDNFGHGVITFAAKSRPSFETSSGYSLLISGPTNMWIDGIHPLTAIVETDWSAYPFPMNWKLSEINKDIVIPSGYPIMCFIPINLSDIESFRINYKDIEQWEKFDDLVKHQQSRPEVPHLEQDKLSKDTTHKSYSKGISATGKKIVDRNKILNLHK